MLGVIFTELTAYIVGRHGDDLLEDVLEGCELSTGGAYTAVGNYPHTEAVEIVVAYAQLANLPVEQVLHDFGHHLFNRFLVLYPAIFDRAQMPETAEAPTCRAFDFLSLVESVIHRQVRMLYAEAHPPRLEVKSRTPNMLQLRYQSHRPMHALAEGLLQGCCQHFGEPVSIACEQIPADPASQPDHRSDFVFTLQRCTSNG